MNAKTYQGLDAPKLEPALPLQQFHCFSKLPAELRSQIWLMAMCRDDTPKVHYYSLFHTDNKGHRNSQLQQMMRDNPPPAPVPHPTHQWDGSLQYIEIENPLLQSRPDQFSWTKANRFLYFCDAGLQNACKESRATLAHYGIKILPRYTKEQQQKLLLRWRSSVIRTLDQEQDVYICVPKDDVVCFRFSPEDIAVCASLSWEIFLTRLPMFHFPRIVDINLTLEYHETWNEGLCTTKMSFLDLLPEPSTRGLALRAYWAWVHGTLPIKARMWLVDRDGGGLLTNYNPERPYTHCDRYGSKDY